MTIKPYAAQEREGYWIAINTLSGRIASCPTTKAQARRDAATLNRAFAEIVAQESDPRWSSGNAAR